jgi:hypothetical protein
MIFSLSAVASESVAFIKSVQGNAIVKRDNTVVLAQKGVSLFSNDILQTGSDGAIGISFNDGTRISLGSKSILVIDDYFFAPSQKDFRFDLSLQKGTAVFESGKISKLAPEKVHFKVPQGVIGIRGTKFVVEAE